LAWPTAEIAVMGPEAAIEIIFRRELAEAADPQALRDRLVREYRAQFATPYVAASRGYLDDVIEPRRTRPRLISALRALAGKRETLPRKKHDNLPL
ncbi:MAG: carboxyl transferase domain-containing protein, partial [Armatimonadota bacterium]|nr:carboxyl transferase domain-containing protein [Armatimonadota bacterium]